MLICMMRALNDSIFKKIVSNHLILSQLVNSIKKIFSDGFYECIRNFDFKVFSIFFIFVITLFCQLAKWLSTVPRALYFVSVIPAPFSTVFSYCLPEGIQLRRYIIYCIPASLDSAVSKIAIICNTVDTVLERVWFFILIASENVWPTNSGGEYLNSFT